MQTSKTLFNPTVFAYTLYVKFADRRYWLLPLLLVIVPSFGIVISFVFPHAALNDEAKKMIAEVVHGYILQPTVYLLLGYIFISDGPASGKIVAESDTLALLFTRPMTRFCYVISRYLAAVLGTSVFMFAAILLAYLVGLCYGVPYIDIGLLTIASIILNAASWCSLLIFLHSAPPLVAFLTLFTLIGCGGIGSIYSQVEQSKNVFLELLKTVSLFVDQWFGDFIPSSVDLVAMTAASAFDTYEFAIFISNIAFFLLIAAFALSCREFSYGSD